MEDLARLVVFILLFFCFLSLLFSYFTVRFTKNLSNFCRVCIFLIVGFLPWFLPKGIDYISFLFYVSGIVFNLILEKIKK